MVSWSERMISHTGTGTLQTPTGGSSEEFCAMGATLTQQRRVSEEGLWVVKLCQQGRNYNYLIDNCIDGTCGGSAGQLRASSRGNTGGASVIRNYWA